MDSGSDGQFPAYGWDEFINSDYYVNSYENSTLLSPLDFLVSFDLFVPSPELTIFSQDFQAGNGHSDQILSPKRADPVEQQDTLQDQHFDVKAKETGLEYKEIKALYGENKTVLTLLTSI